MFLCYQPTKQDKQMMLGYFIALNKLQEEQEKEEVKILDSIIIIIIIKRWMHFPVD